MSIFTVEYTVVAECDNHNHEHKELCTRRVRADDVEAALDVFFWDWSNDDYEFFKNLKFCPECEMLSSTSCDIDAIEIILADDKDAEPNKLGNSVPTALKNTQNKELFDGLGLEFEETYSAYAVCSALRAKNVLNVSRFRKERMDTFVRSVLELFGDDATAAKAEILSGYDQAKKKIKFTAYSEYIALKSVPTSVKNAQNKSFCDLLGVGYHKIHAAKAVVMILMGQGIEPRKFRTDHKLDFAGAVLALFKGNKADAKKALEKGIEEAKLS